MTELCLTLLFPAARNDSVFDVLMTLPQIDAFSSTAGAVHGVPAARLNAREQVLGYAAMTQVQAIVAVADQAALLETLAAHFGGTGLRYWITPVLASGEFA